MSHLIAHGHAEILHGNAPSRQNLASAFLADDGSIEIVAESDDHGDITITFPPTTVEKAFARRGAHK